MRTEVKSYYLEQKQKRVPFNNLGKLTPWIKSEVTSLGVILDSDLSFQLHINKAVKTSYFHLRNIAKGQLLINIRDAEKRIHGFISSLKYCEAKWRASHCSLHWASRSQKLLTKTTS